jgi:hypothetical protein
MKRKLEIIGLCIGWFAIIGQFVLMLQNRQTDIPEMVVSLVFLPFQLIH